MSERFTRLFSLEENLYSYNSPVLIKAGALLKDNNTGKIIAQLKFENISSINSPIISAEVDIITKDIEDNIIGTTVNYQYLDLRAKQHETFGDNTPIFVDKSTRGFDVVIKKAIFEDKSVWKEISDEFSPLGKNEALESHFNNEELVKQYRINNGEFCKFIPRKEKDLWVCSCGLINRDNNLKCNGCNSEFENLVKGLDLNQLNEQKEKRLLLKKEEEQRRVEKRKEAELKSAKAMRTIAIVTAIAMVAVVAVMAVTRVIIPNNNYNKAVEMAESGQYQEAIAIYEKLGDYKDSKEQISETLYNQAMEFIGKEDYITAAEILKELGDYKDSNDLYQQTKLSSALQIAQKGNIGDTLQFGNYEWQILAKDNNKTLIITTDSVGEKTYNTDHETITWENCNLREWLNNVFYNEFNDEEKAVVATTHLKNKNNSRYGTNGGKDTDDKVFLLSIDEANEYFKTDKERAIGFWWWLRSPGYIGNTAAYVTNVGYVNVSGDDVYDEFTVRPALWINLE